MIYGYLRVSSDEQDVNSQKQGLMEGPDCLIRKRRE